MNKLQHSMRAFRDKIKEGRQGMQEVIEGDPTSQKNWKLGTGWFVGVDVYPTRDAELTNPKRLERLLPGATMPASQAQAIELLSAGIKRSRAARSPDAAGVEGATSE